jgi:hypothetical protein
MLSLRLLAKCLSNVRFTDDDVFTFRVGCESSGCPHILTDFLSRRIARSHFNDIAQSECEIDTKANEGIFTERIDKRPVIEDEGLPNFWQYALLYLALIVADAFLDMQNDNWMCRHPMSTGVAHIHAMQRRQVQYRARNALIPADRRHPSLVSSMTIGERHLMHMFLVFVSPTAQICSLSRTSSITHNSLPPSS